MINSAEVSEALVYWKDRFQASARELAGWLNANPARKTASSRSACRSGSFLDGSLVERHHLRFCGDGRSVCGYRHLLADCRHAYTARIRA